MPSIYTQISFDYGVTWSSETFIATGNTPSQAELSDGVLVVSYEDSGTCYLRESDRNGESGSWSAAFGAQSGSYPFIWTDSTQSILYRVYYSSPNVKFHYSTDRGDTWSTPVIVASPGSPVEACGLTLADGRLRVSYELSGLWYNYESSDGGTTWA